MESKLALWVKKKKIAENGDYNLTGNRYREAVDYSKVKWSMVRLGEVCDFINGRAFKPKDWEKKEKGGLPIIRIQNLNNSKAEFNYYSVDVAKKLIVRNGDLLFSWSGSRGTSFGPHIWNRNKAILNQHIFRVEFSQKYIKEFLYHMLKKIVSEVESNLHGGVGLVHITKGNLKQIQIPLPPLEVQKEIVAELNSYQKVIDGARQVAENWKPRIKINPDWPMVTLVEVISLEYGKPLKKSDRTGQGYPVFGSNGEVGKHSKYLVEGPFVIVGRKGSAGAVTYSVESGFPIDTTFYVKIKDQDKLNLKFLYFQMLTLDLDKVNQQAGVPGLNRNDAYQKQIHIPPIGTQEQIVAEIEAEQKMVEECKKLITIHEQKIKNRIAEVWGE